MDDREVLLDLYHEDRKLRFLEKRLGEIPGALESLRQDGLKTESLRDLRIEERSELEAAVRRLEQEIPSQQARLDQLRKRQKQVTSVEAMEAGEREIAGLEASVEELETQVLEKMETLEIMAREDQLRGPVDEADRGKLLQEAEELETELVECGQERDAALIARDRLIKILSDKWRRRYERLFAGFGYGCLTGLENGACGHCGEKLPPQQAIDVEKKGDLHPCQGCGRLVMRVGEL